MKNNFDLRKFLIENKVTKNSKALQEALTVVGHTEEELKKNAEELVAAAEKAGRKATIEYNTNPGYEDQINSVDIGAPGLGTPDEVRAVQDRQFADYEKNKKPNQPGTTKDGKKLKKLTVGGKTYEKGEEDSNGEGRIEQIEKYSNGYLITGGIYSDYGDGDEPKEQYSYAIDLKGNEIDEEDLDMFNESKSTLSEINNNNKKEMKNNFDLKKFLTENKLTSNSRQIVNENQLPDATKDLKASDAFKAVGIDMNEPVLVLTQDGGHGEQETKGTVSAQEALKMFQQLRAKGMEDDKQDYYEFENEINFSAEGYEYKIAYFEEESTTTALMQKSGVNEIDADLLKRAQNTPVPKGAKDRLAKRKAGLDNERAGTLQVSKGPNAEQEQKVIDIARDAIALMDEQPGTSAEDALNSVLGA